MGTVVPEHMHLSSPHSTQILPDTVPGQVCSGQGGGEMGIEPGEVVNPPPSLPKAGEEGLDKVYTVG